MDEIPTEVGSTYEVDGEVWQLLSDSWGETVHCWWAPVTDPGRAISIAEFEKKVDMVRYPESDKLSKRREERRAINEFLEWAEEHNNHLGTYVRFPDEWDDRFVPLTAPSDRLVLEYFGVDPKELEKERRAMLDAQRELNDGD